MAAPVYYNVEEYQMSSGFATTFSSGDTGGATFDVGSSGNKSIIAVVNNTASSGSGDNISSFVLGGVTFTALTQNTITGVAKQRVFYALSADVSSLSGAQSWTSTCAGGTATHQVQIYVASGNATFTDIGLQTQSGNSFSYSSSTTADDLLLGIGIMQCGGSFTSVQGVNSTVLRGSFGTTIVRVELEEPGGAGSAVEASVTGPGTTPAWNVYVMKLTGSASSGRRGGMALLGVG